jgi:hypothetical protein
MMSISVMARIVPSICLIEVLMLRLKILVPASALLLLQACAGAQQPKYNWGNYSASLIGSQEDVGARPDYEKALAAIINDPSRRVPPGIYAEYGYVLQQRGDTTGAATMYAREKTAWPESTYLMNKMTGQVTVSGKPTS